MFQLKKSGLETPAVLNPYEDKPFVECYDCSYLRGRLQGKTRVLPFCVYYKLHFDSVRRVKGRESVCTNWCEC